MPIWVWNICGMEWRLHNLPGQPVPVFEFVSYTPPKLKLSMMTCSFDLHLLYGCLPIPFSILVTHMEDKKSPLLPLRSYILSEINFPVRGFDVVQDSQKLPSIPLWIHKLQYLLLFPFHSTRKLSAKTDYIFSFFISILRLDCSLHTSVCSVTVFSVYVYREACQSTS